MLTSEEVQCLFKQIENLKHRTLLTLIYSWGLRIGETLSPRPTGIDSGAELIYIRGGKGNKDRPIPLSPRVLTRLRKYHDAYYPKVFLFKGQKGGKYSNRSDV